MVGVWMAPVTAQVMMTLFDVAMFEVSWIRPATRGTARPGPMRRVKYMILLFFSAVPAMGAKENAPPPLGGQHEALGFEPFGGPPLPIHIKAIPAYRIMRGSVHVHHRVVAAGARGRGSGGCRHAPGVMNTSY
jgi:hypothetical protein